MIEPLLDPALEQQAVSRVHRIGQQNPTFVHRFIIRDTIEERVVDMHQARKHTTDGTSNKRPRGNHHAAELLTSHDIGKLFDIEIVEAADDAMSVVDAAAVDDDDEEELEVLDHLISSSSATIDDADDKSTSEEYWHQLVEYRARPMMRERALQQMQVLHSYECLARNSRIDQEPRAKLMGRAVVRALAQELVSLPSWRHDQQ